MLVMMKEAVRTARAIGQWTTHPWRSPSDVGDNVDTAVAHTFENVRQARRFRKQHPKGFRFILGTTVFYDRDMNFYEHIQ